MLKDIIVINEHTDKKEYENLIILQEYYNYDYNKKDIDNIYEIIRKFENKIIETKQDTVIILYITFNRVRVGLKYKLVCGVTLKKSEKLEWYHICVYCLRSSLSEYINSNTPKISNEEIIQNIFGVKGGEEYVKSIREKENIKLNKRQFSNMSSKEN